MKAGDIVWLDLNPTKGHEQQGHRPALVISEPMRTLSIVVPLTSTPPKFPAHHPMTGTGTSTALCEQVRSIDQARITKVQGTAHPDDLRAVRAIVAKLIGVHTT
jgi:mRNA interferase MazF